MSTRRSFLQMLGIAPVVGAVGPARSAATLHAPEGVGAAVQYSTLTGDAEGLATDKMEYSAHRYVDAYKKWRDLTGQTLPPHRMNQILRDTRVVSHIDADIASLRSYSATTKERMQRERNVRTQVTTAVQHLEDNASSEEFSKLEKFFI